MLVLSKNPVWLWRCPTKRAPDVWDSAAFSSIFLVSSFSYSQAESTPAHTQVTQTVEQRNCRTYAAVDAALIWAARSLLPARSEYSWLRPFHAERSATELLVRRLSSLARMVP
jgi:hypothetical protein